MSEQSVARQYAGALFTVAHRNGTVEAVRQDLEGFDTVLAGHAELRDVFASPVVPPRRKRALVDALLQASAPATDEFRRMLTLLADRDRLVVLSSLTRAFVDRVMEADRSVDARVTTAMPIPADRQEGLAQALGQATGRRVTVTNHVDPAIVGGMVAEVGGTVFDGSVAGQLNRMRQRVAADF